tara:strand:+ start:901 stop:1422 length:522 start_codon:yes stop_codon:yes gene_type:complete
MLKFKRLLVIRFCYALLIGALALPAYADGYLTPADLENINYQCYLEETEIVFCSEEEILDPQIIVKIPLLKPVLLSNGIRAYRLMATIQNETKRNLIGAKIFLTFDEEKKQSVEIIISEKIIYKDTSSTKRSHLIRSDVPQNFSLYQTLDQIYFDAEISNIKLHLKELKFENG